MNWWSSPSFGDGLDQSKSYTPQARRWSSPSFGDGLDLQWQESILTKRWSSPSFGDGLDPTIAKPSPILTFSEFW